MSSATGVWHEATVRNCDPLPTLPTCTEHTRHEPNASRFGASQEGRYEVLALYGRQTGGLLAGLNGKRLFVVDERNFSGSGFGDCGG
ncbi:MAG: hypothetical protein R2825_11205 [Saprospiraceae bacterium]